jgi:hypothetical protein
MVKTKKLMRLGVALIAVAVLGAACQRQTENAAPKSDDKMSKEVTSETGAAALRAGLNNLLSEHVYLAALASSSALAGDTATFNAFADALNGKGSSNSTDLISAIGSAYGPDVQKAFDPLWRKHIGFVVEFVGAAGEGDEVGKKAAVDKLVAYADEFGAVIESINGLPKKTVSELVLMHITTLKDVIDAQVAKDQPKVYAGLRKAYGHMDMIAGPLADATAKKFPDKFDGSALSAPSGLRSTMNLALREHVFLAFSAARGALGGNTAAFNAAADALNGTGPSNSTDIIATIGSAYGSDVQKAFDPLWRKHIGFVVDYVGASGKGDEAGKKAAVDKLVAYADEFGAVIESVTDNRLPKKTVSELVLEHITSLKDTIDAAVAKDSARVARLLRESAGHMPMIADPLTQATVDKFPEKFGG